MKSNIFKKEIYIGVGIFVVFNVFCWYKTKEKNERIMETPVFVNAIVTGFEHGSQSNAWLNIKIRLIKLTIKGFSEVLDVILLIGVQKEMVVED